MYPRSYAQYTLLERLATGGMSEVDLARRSVDDAGYVRFLVIKRIKANKVEDDAFVRMFKDEARITSELRHTNIAQVYDFGRVGDEYYLALEYVPGTDLRAVLATLRARRERMPVRYALAIAAGVLDALHYAHTRTDSRGRPMHIIHRDVNPRNVMISVSGEVKLIDFGVARATDRLERTQTDHFKGKIAYMAPEQVKGTDLDHRVDVFAMGLTLYEMLAGRGAFAGLDQTQILYRILQGELPALEVPRSWGEAGRLLQEVLEKALATDPKDRFADAAAFARALREVALSFGGMPERTDLAAWVGQVQPELHGSIQEKLDAFTGELAGDLPDGPAPANAPATRERPVPGDSSGTMEGGTLSGGTTEGTGTFSPVVVAAGVGTAGVVALVALGLLLGGVIAGAIWWSLPTDPPEVAAIEHPEHPPEPLDTPVVDEDRTPLRPGTLRVDPEAMGAPADTLDPSTPYQDPMSGGGERTPRAVATGRTPMSPSAGGSGDNGGGPAQPVAAGADQGGSSPKAADPAPEPAVQDEPPVAAATPTAPAPVARGFGTLQVSSARKGLPVFIDGKRTEYRTPASFRWPEGVHTVSVDGYQPVTVEVGKGLVKPVVFR